MKNCGVLIDPRDYRSFCFRGEGRANFVISAKNEATGQRIVWRFAKQRKSGLLTVKARSELVNNYMNRLIAPLFSPHYLVSPRMVNFRVEGVHQIAKIPSLPPNRKIERYEDLFELPESSSFFPLNAIPKGCSRISALEMVDATRIPKEVDCFYGPTITVEIKPKQGFFQRHAGFELSHCNNCVLQIEKCSSDSFETMYDFCPLDLYSGELGRMRASLEALFKVPHRNLRVFVNGDMVHSDERALEFEKLDAVLFPDGSQNIYGLIDALCCALAGQRSADAANFCITADSVLGQIQAGQVIDKIGIAEAHALFTRLPAHDQNQLKERGALAKRTLGLLNETDDRALLEQYFLAATMKDCSVMISLRMVPAAVAGTVALEDTVIVAVQDVFFAVSLKIVDLDPKSAKNLVNAYERFTSGADLLAKQPTLRRPCVHITNSA
ncbi:unnamed protein product, partial [Mesorhabditis spiculigera]